MNTDTHIFQSMRALAVGYNAAQQPLAKEIERLNGHRQTAAFYIGLARAALSEGKLAQAEAYLNQAEQAATVKE